VNVAMPLTRIRAALVAFFPSPQSRARDGAAQAV
jgi:hypothetical protein